MHAHDLRWMEIKQKMNCIHLELAYKDVIMWVWKRENDIIWKNKKDQIWKYIHAEYMKKIISMIFNISNRLSFITYWCLTGISNFMSSIANNNFFRETHIS